MNPLRRVKAAYRALIAPPAKTPERKPRPSPPPTVYVGEKLLPGRTALVTGAGTNIGRAIALEMGRHGARIVFTDIDGAACARLEQDLDAQGIRHRGFVADVSDLAATDAMMDTLNREGIQVDILVNNVGILANHDTRDVRDIESWRRAFETNVFGPIHLTNRVSIPMRDRGAGGCILFLSSIHQWGVRLNPSYGASKGAIGMIVKELAVDLAPHGIRVNGIAPGWIALDEAGHPHAHPYTLLGGASISPDYVARAAVFLASDHYSGFTTGATLTVDGGLSLYNHSIAQWECLA